MWVNPFIRLYLNIFDYKIADSVFAIGPSAMSLLPFVLYLEVGLLLATGLLVCSLCSVNTFLKKQL